MSSASYDVVIVGGGVIGSAVAYYISKSRKLNIALIDVKKPGNASRASAGGLWPIGESVGLGCGVIFFKTYAKRKEEDPNAPPPRPHQLPEFFFDFCLKSNDMFPELWVQLRDEYGVDFKLEKTGLKFVIYDEHDRLYAQQIYDSIPHLQKHLSWQDAAQLKSEEPNITPDAQGALLFDTDDQVNPFLLTRAFREAARQNGVSIIMESEVTGILRDGDRVTGVSTKDRQFNAGTVINAAGAWASEIAQMALGWGIPVSPVKGQIILSEKMPPILKSCVSTSDCYMAQKDNGEILIGSTTEEEGFDVSCTIEALKGLTQGAVKCVPLLKELNIKRAWAGLRPGTPDEIPILGPVEGVEGYLNACGHFRTGILTSAITGSVFEALLDGKPSPVDLKPFALERFSASE